MAKYSEIVDYLLAKIANHEIRSAWKMPTIRKLADLFQCSKETVVRAYLELQKKHVVYSVPQKGYFLVKQADKVSNSRMIDFAVAAPCEEALPYTEFQHCLNQAIDQYQYALFNYSNAQGLPGLIDVLVKYLQEYQVFANPEQVFITTGAQQAISILTAMKFVNNKTAVLVEQPKSAGDEFCPGRWDRAEF
ncbi:MAG: aminotransferase class I/II-fold pyridoxal phosphate-dependent enzyme [Phycisphaerales bacterium]